MPVIRKHIRGLLLLEFDVPEPSLTAMAREQLDLLAEHAALLWQEQELEAQLQDEDISSGRFMNRLKSLFLRVPVLINGFDTAGRCILWNNECERVFGWSFEELEHQAAPIEIFYPDAEERQRVIGTLQGSAWYRIQRVAPCRQKRASADNTVGQYYVTQWRHDLCGPRYYRAENAVSAAAAGSQCI
ncbi:PAS domain S-box protein [Oceanimonas baumannii]|uniref:PAS domain S-box protein n=1 Tax=Oceanimonas baumannii TaxID=129578 RepID=UPI003A902986